MMKELESASDTTSNVGTNSEAAAQSQHPPGGHQIRHVHSHPSMSVVPPESGSGSCGNLQGPINQPLNDSTGLSQGTYVNKAKMFRLWLLKKRMTHAWTLLLLTKVDSFSEKRIFFLPYVTQFPHFWKKCISRAFSHLSVNVLTLLEAIDLLLIGIILLYKWNGKRRVNTKIALSLLLSINSAVICY